eukprot:CAMPEP_0183774424 /NCGR_PEP_ID=MMETSP0739-20130205/41972_1 /TAXON_ID=385413 /ORGANISM="Thalassiosira miniscula, Strain CCMP1093" /LENGTH=49 /DNA_ID= /DNA_START= /DNA_END= /DNA_ORIENTATION=
MTEVISRKKLGVNPGANALRYRFHSSPCTKRMLRSPKMGMTFLRVHDLW